jgi:hypothetical protein
MNWFALSFTKKGIAVAGGGLLDYIIDNPDEELVISRGRTQEKIYFYVNIIYLSIFLNFIKMLLFLVSGCEYRARKNERNNI